MSQARLSGSLHRFCPTIAYPARWTCHTKTTLPKGSQQYIPYRRKGASHGQNRASVRHGVVVGTGYSANCTRTSVQFSPAITRQRVASGTGLAGLSLLGNTGRASTRQKGTQHGSTTPKRSVVRSIPALLGVRKSPISRLRLSRPAADVPAALVGICRAVCLALALLGNLTD